MTEVVNKVRNVLRLRDEFLGLLVKAQESRNNLTCEDWIAFERNTMHAAVNRERTRLGESPISLEAVERVERMACGHSDYSRKFALYCVELAYGVPVKP